MKRSKFLTISVVSCILFNSCVHYQYSRIRSDIYQSDAREFVVENSGVTVKYFFSGQNCPVHIEIHNRQSKPVYVDWSRSSVIINGERYSYWKDTAVVNASVSSSEINWSKTVSTESGDVKGTISRGEKISFIPPRSFIKVNPLNMKKDRKSTRLNSSHT